MEREEFYGNFLLTWPGVLFFGTIISYFWLGINVHRAHAPSWEGYVAFSPLLLFLFLFGFQLFYFRITDDSLEIKNHIFRWYRKRYLLKDIDTLIFEKWMNAMPNSLRVKGAGFRTFSYFAGSLRDVDWYDFDKVLRKKGIPLDNKLWRF